MGIKAWITVNGNHIPVMDGESKMKALGRFINGKRDAHKSNYKPTIKGRKKSNTEIGNELAKNREIAKAFGNNAAVDKYNEALMNLSPDKNKKYRFDEIDYKSAAAFADNFDVDLGRGLTLSKKDKSNGYEIVSKDGKYKAIRNDKGAEGNYIIYEKKYNRWEETDKGNSIKQTAYRMNKLATTKRGEVPDEEYTGRRKSDGAPGGGKYLAGDSYRSPSALRQRGKGSRR